MDYNAPQNPSGMQGMQDILDRLGPEGLAQLTQLDQLQEQNAALEGLRKQAQPYGPIGSGLKAIGDVIGAWAMKRNMGQQGAGRQALANAYFGIPRQPMSFFDDSTPETGDQSQSQAGTDPMSAYLQSQEEADPVAKYLKALRATQGMTPSY